MHEVVKGVRRDQRVRAEMKGGRDPGGDVAGHGPVGPGEAGPREKANHWRSRWTHTQCGEGTLCNKEEEIRTEGEEEKEGGRSGPEGLADRRKVRVLSLIHI